ncbi:MAG: hypothetical protein UZ15_CFX003002748 [Chloroflexi bacterium OLB15]|nr:MAG: hypothetical protein UZ15_CFX003002748 [Chloroflexi bacterium OLB15]
MNEECAALDAIEQLREAAPRFSEFKVQAAYEMVMRVLESYGDGDLYEGEPLNETQLALLARALPEALPGDMPPAYIKPIAPCIARCTRLRQRGNAPQGWTICPRPPKSLT